MNSDKYLFTQVELFVKSHDKGARTASFSIIGHQTYLRKTQGQAFSFNNKVVLIYVQNLNLFKMEQCPLFKFYF